MKVFYSEKMLAEPEASFSPSASKPKLVAEALARMNFPLELVEPEPVTVDDFNRVHYPYFVNAILKLRAANGFGTKSASLAQSLPWTSGAMLSAARAALKEGSAAALCSGFHHAGYDFCEGYCTFNGLAVTAAKLLVEAAVSSVLILDCDMHFGDGTADIIHRRRLQNIRHETFGRKFLTHADESAYLEALDQIRDEITRSPVSLILYQAGADAHVDDPLGGVLNTAGFRERERRVFQMAHDLKIPIAWNLAGGYQRDGAGAPSPVVDLHLITFEEWVRAFAPQKGA
jgi:acetoin utilization deacetylase AcuC-like enzyme